MSKMVGKSMSDSSSLPQSMQGQFKILAFSKAAAMYMTERQLPSMAEGKYIEIQCLCMLLEVTMVQEEFRANVHLQE